MLATRRRRVRLGSPVNATRAPAWREAPSAAAEGFGGFDAGGFSGWVEAGGGAGGEAEEGCPEQEGGFDDGAPAAEQRDGDDGGEPEGSAEDSAEDAEGRRLCDDVGGDVAPGGAEGAAEPDLGGAFHDGDQRGVGDADGADEEADAGEGVEE